MSARRPAAGCPGRIPHDMPRTTLRNLNRAGVPETVAMKISGGQADLAEAESCVRPSLGVFVCQGVVTGAGIEPAARALKGSAGTFRTFLKH